ncbi:MAG TPA: hypothetical protein VHZ95_22160, partial [Polyangiales bacterium]|nr:hypothetical protein [Polyangiales bacterium]
MTAAVGGRRLRAGGRAAGSGGIEAEVGGTERRTFGNGGGSLPVARAAAGTVSVLMFRADGGSDVGEVVRASLARDVIPASAARVDAADGGGGFDGSRALSA